MIVYNYDADLEVSDTCVRSSLLSWVELSCTVMWKTFVFYERIKWLIDWLIVVRFYCASSGHGARADRSHGVSQLWSRSGNSNSLLIYCLLFTVYSCKHGIETERSEMCKRVICRNHATAVVTTHEASDCRVHGRRQLVSTGEFIGYIHWTHIGFFPATVTLWNNLPSDVVLSPCVNCFRLGR